MVIKFKAPVQGMVNPAARVVAQLHENPGLVERLVRAVSGPTGKLIHNKMVNGKGWSDKITEAYEAGKHYDYDSSTNIVQDFRKATGNQVPVVITSPKGNKILPYKKVHPKEISPEDLQGILATRFKGRGNRYFNAPTAGMPVVFGGGHGVIQLQEKVHPATVLHETGHYYQLADPTFNPKTPSYLNKVLEPTSSQRFQQEVDAWDRMGVPKDERDRIAALASYELGAHKIRHEAAGALINTGAVGALGAGAYLLKRSRDAKRVKKLAQRPADPFRDAAVIGGVGLGAAGTGAYLLNKRRKQHDE